jgi:uncharacterized protein (DUF885 family)
MTNRFASSASLGLRLCVSTLLALPLPLIAAEPLAPGKQLERIADRYLQDSFDLNPLYASFILGDPKYDGRLEITIAPAHLAKLKTLQARVLRETAALPADKLSEADRLTLAVLRHQAQTRLDSFAYPEHLMAMDHYGGLPVQLAQFGTGESIQPLKTVKNYEDYLKRLNRIPEWTDQAIANVREGIKRGVVQPKPLIERSLEPLKALTEPDVEKNPFYLAIKRMPDNIPQADRNKLTAAYRTAIQRRLQPAMVKLARFIEKESLPKGRETSGIDALPDGAKWYAYQVRAHTTTRMTPEEIHQLGLREVARIRGEMEKIKAHYKFEGTLTEFLKTHSTRPEFRPFKTEQEVLDAYQALNQKIMPQLAKLFNRAPKARLEIRAEPELTRATASDHYNAPAIDGSRPGAFFAVIMDPKEYSTTGMATLFLHEGQPGHHYHIALQQELPLPRFRKYDWITAYGEGWALYAETLGREMGLYDDPNSYLGHLSDELLRAVRLVTDTGLHAKGWTREKTIQYMMDTHGYSEHESRRATERYMADPGQALAYKIGALKIRELRDRAQAKLGDKFTYAAFHDQVLSDGALPLELLEAKIDRWIASQSK